MKTKPTTIPRKLRAELALDPEYRICSLDGYPGHVCAGRITWEHAIIYGGKKVQERWAIIPLCARAHDVDFYQDGHNMVKELNVWVALNRATPQELRLHSKVVPYTDMLARLNAKYGVWQIPVESLERTINNFLDSGRERDLEFA